MQNQKNLNIGPSALDLFGDAYTILISH